MYIQILKYDITIEHDWMTIYYQQVCNVKGIFPFPRKSFSTKRQKLYDCHWDNTGCYICSVYNVNFSLHWHYTSYTCVVYCTSVDVNQIVSNVNILFRNSFILFYDTFLSQCFHCPLFFLNDAIVKYIAKGFGLFSFQKKIIFL